MSRYLLQDLVRVREHREDKAGKELTLARRRAQEAEQLVVTRQKELDEYKRWRLEEEERLIQSIMLKKVRLGEITDIRLEIAGLRERELEFVDRLRRAEGERDAALEAQEAARLAHMKATQELEKLLEHRIQWEQEVRLEAERLADLELEDFQGPPGSRHEDDSAANNLEFRHGEN